MGRNIADALWEMLQKAGVKRCVPHIGSATIETRTAMGMLALDNVDAVLNGRPAPTLVQPAVAAGRLISVSERFSRTNPLG